MYSKTEDSTVFFDSHPAAAGACAEIEWRHGTTPLPWTGGSRSVAAVAEPSGTSGPAQNQRPLCVRDLTVCCWFKQSLFAFMKMWTIKSIKQARLIVNAHKHN